MLVKQLENEKQNKFLKIKIPELYRASEYVGNAPEVQVPSSHYSWRTGQVT